MKRKLNNTQEAMRKNHNLSTLVVRLQAKFNHFVEINQLTQHLEITHKRGWEDSRLIRKEVGKSGKELNKKDDTGREGPDGPHCLSEAKFILKYCAR
jgi:hypothetical protein